MDEGRRANMTEVKKSALDIKQNMGAQVNKLDSMLSRTDRAQAEMERQTKVMKNLMK